MGATAQQKRPQKTGAGTADQLTIRGHRRQSHPGAAGAARAQMYQATKEKLSALNSPKTPDERMRAPEQIQSQSILNLVPFGLDPRVNR